MSSSWLVTTMLLTVAVPGEALALGDGLGAATASCAVAKVALLMSAKTKAISFFKVIFSWLQLD
jgi:hypothetical protein